MLIELVVADVEFDEGGRDCRVALDRLRERSGAGREGDAGDCATDLEEGLDGLRREASLAEVELRQRMLERCEAH